jgi:hypothetical protein
MNNQFIIFEENSDSIHYKIKYPSIEKIKKLNINFNESYDHLILFEYEVGIHDANAYVSKIAFIKNNQLFVFMEYNNPEHFSYYSFICDEQNFYKDTFISCHNFFKEAFFIKLSSTFITKNEIKRNKI